ncbi:hypothetical protein HanIR_Chr08g0348091 [Helianthus annuus]|nr:hypothetical protein HanIR_Chr08g0348091 [Helianthus annuus]
MIVPNYKKINLASGYFNQKIFCAMCIQINFQSFSKMSQLSVFTSAGYSRHHYSSLASFRCQSLLNNTFRYYYLIPCGYLSTICNTFDITNNS